MIQGCTRLGIPTGTLNLRGHADHEKSSYVAVALLADPAQALLAATGFVQRREPEPGGELAPVLELLAVADRGDDGRGGDGANAGTRSDALGAFVDPGMILDQLVVKDTRSSSAITWSQSVLSTLFARSGMSGNRRPGRL